MNYQQLFEAQRKLDEHIIEKKQLQGQDLFNDTVQALLCEIQETANETKCFKHWSNKEPNQANVLEETADSFHFILSLSNSLNVEPVEVEKQPARVYEDLTEQFIVLSYTISCIAMFGVGERVRYYLETIKLFKGLLHLLNISENQLEQAYYKKNKVNYERQEANY